MTTKDIKVGDRFERLEILEIIPVYKKHAKAKVQCSCEKRTIKTVLIQNLIKLNGTKSCGCLQKEIISKITSERNKKHNLTKHPLYITYQNLHSRCYNKNNKRYVDYGKRGITVCDEWKNNFITFYNWAINNGWEKHLTIERIDNEGNYQPNNCKWATYSEQANNKRNNHFVTAFNENKTLIDWTKDSRCVVTYHRLINRINILMWDAEKAITTPIKNMNNKQK